MVFPTSSRLLLRPLRTFLGAQASWTQPRAPNMLWEEGSVCWVTSRRGQKPSQHPPPPPPTLTAKIEDGPSIKTAMLCSWWSPQCFPSTLATSYSGNQAYESKHWKQLQCPSVGGWKREPRSTRPAKERAKACALKSNTPQMYLRAMETACHGGNKHTHGMGVCMGFPATLHYALNTRWWRLWAWGEQLKRLDVWVSIISSVDSIFFFKWQKS